MLCCRDVSQSCAHHTFLVESCSSKSTVMHEPLVIVSTHGAMCHAIHVLQNCYAAQCVRESFCKLV